VLKTDSITLEFLNQSQNSVALKLIGEAVRKVLGNEKSALMGDVYQKDFIPIINVQNARIESAKDGVLKIWNYTKKIKESVETNGLKNAALKVKNETVQGAKDLGDWSKNKFEELPKTLRN
jgi:hypothetical protein